MKGYSDAGGNMLGPCTVDGLSCWVLVTPHCYLHSWQHLVVVVVVVVCVCVCVCVCVYML